MKSILRRTVLTLAGVLLVSSHAFAADLGVEATVINSCEITTSPVVFGNYDPIVTNKTAAIDLSGTIHTTCTNGLAATVSLGLGANALVAARRMKNGASFMTYELFTSALRTTIWNATNTVPTTGTGVNQDLTVYGRVAGGQNTLIAGSYADTVVATINF